MQVKQSRNNVKICLKNQEDLYNNLLQCKSHYPEVLCGITLQQIGILEQILQRSVCDFHIFEQNIPKNLENYQFSLIFLQNSKEVFYINMQSRAQRIDLKENFPMKSWPYIGQNHYHFALQYFISHVSPKAKLQLHANHCHIVTPNNALWSWIQNYKEILPINIKRNFDLLYDYYSIYQTQNLFLPIVKDELKNVSNINLCEPGELMVGFSDVFHQFEILQMQREKTKVPQNQPLLMSNHNHNTPHLSQSIRYDVLQDSLSQTSPNQNLQENGSLEEQIIQLKKENTQYKAQLNFFMNEQEKRNKNSFTLSSSILNFEPLMNNSQNKLNFFESPILKHDPQSQEKNFTGSLSDLNFN